MSLLRWIPLLVWGGIIFYLSSLSHPGLPHFPYSDKVMHAAVYCVFGIFAVRVLQAWKRPFSWKMAMGWGLIASLIYGASDEFHQAFVPFRTPEVMDVIFDGLGGSLGGLFWFFIHRILNERNPRKI